MKEIIIGICILLIICMFISGTVLSNEKEGKASWYGKNFHGKKTASGETYNMYDYTCAAKNSIKLGTKIEVTNLSNGKSVIVRVNDRGNFYPKRDLDLSRQAFNNISKLTAGIIKIKYRIIE